VVEGEADRTSRRFTCDVLRRLWRFLKMEPTVSGLLFGSRTFA